MKYWIIAFQKEKYVFLESAINYTRIRRPHLEAKGKQTSDQQTKCQRQEDHVLAV